MRHEFRFGQWTIEHNNSFPTIIDRCVYGVAWLLRVNLLIKYHSRNRWRLPKITRVKSVEPEMRWRELVVGQYGFSWIKHRKTP